MFTLGRKIDINYPTNKIILIVSLLAAALGWFITGEILSGAYIGAGTFLSWALAREVDPKHEYSAFLCVVFSFLNIFYYESIQLLVVFWMLLMIRTVNGITGKELTSLDVFSVFGLTIYLSINHQNSIYLLPFLLAMAFVINYKEKKNLILIAGGLGLAAFLVESFFMGYLSFNSRNYLWAIDIFVLAIIGISFIVWGLLSKDEVRDDLGNIIKKSKILLSQTIYSLMLVLIYFFGDMSVNNLIIYLSVIIGIAIYWVGSKIFSKNTSTA